ncbi:MULTISPECIES: hypothetical protein [unclassified Pseudoalteromonas]
MNFPRAKNLVLGACLFISFGKGCK